MYNKYQFQEIRQSKKNPKTQKFKEKSVKICVEINETENNDITEKQQCRSQFTEKTNKTDKSNPSN